ncbi:MAG: primosomal protein N' [Phascolarctobacterium sp.]|nr:MAG: primosomal protein N' [Phascolarctobacterium sp.]
MRYINVAINLPVKNLFRQFTYALPPQFNYIGAGWRVIVPFAHQTTEGFVVGEAGTDLPQPENYKAVQAVIGAEPWFDEEMLEAARWLAGYYMCPLAEAMRLFIPGKSSIKRHAVYDENGRLLYYELENRLKEKTQFCYTITENGRQALAEGNKRAKAQMAVLQLLADDGRELNAAEMEAAGVRTETLRTLMQKGWCRRGEQRVLRNSYAAKSSAKQSFNLTDEQQHAVDAVSRAIYKKEQQTFLLQGVTGSGKTEVYLNLTAAALAEGRQVLVLVPEIALTAQIVKRFQSWFKGSIAVVHSKLSAGERADVFYKIRTGEAQILIGVRSAVFAPFADLGLVIIDEEHDQSYKQEERPCYHAREVALRRADYFGVPVVLGSATPSIESYYNAISGKYAHLRLTGRPNGQPLPKVQIVDMRKELQNKNFSVLSRTLQQELVRTAAAGEQAIVLLNRRGYSTFVMCRDCGETIICPHCAVALVYHEAGKVMRCHYCGNTMPVPDECPKCHSRRIKFFGTGTQKAEAQIAALPEVKVLRMDQDRTLRKFAHEEILSAFASGKYNVLIGTQMVAKGHDIPNVTLVGVLSADSALNMPDFRASERAFSLLTQAAGRAGRGDKPGHVVLQVYDADSRTVKLAAAQDYDTFAREELERRRELNYPPYAAFLKITVWDKDEARANKTAQEITDFLQSVAACKSGAEVFGPFAGIINKVRDLYRVNVLVKSAEIDVFKEALWQSPYRGMKNVYFDVDPFNVL